MKPSTILVGTFAIFIPASALPPHTQPSERGIIKIGSDFTSGLVNIVNHFPGSKDAQKILHCLKQHKTWKADYSHKEDGTITFSNMPSMCCEMAKESWGNYKKDWVKVSTPLFHTPCDGGQLNNMKPQHIEMLRKIVGDGEKRK